MTLSGFLLMAWAAHLAGVAPVEEPSPDGLRDVLYLLRSRVPAAAVRAYVEKAGLSFSLVAQDLVELTEAGADEGLLVFMLERTSRAGEPVPLEDAEIVHQTEGHRALRRRAADGRETLVLTNIDEHGLRLDRPADLPSPLEGGEDEETDDMDEDAETGEAASSPEPPAAERAPEARAQESSPPYRCSTGSGMVFVGPYYQFVPSNVPGPHSSWSPVYHLTGVYVPWMLWSGWMPVISSVYGGPFGPYGFYGGPYGRPTSSRHRFGCHY
jgi:hypothetical protein